MAYQNADLNNDSVADATQPFDFTYKEVSLSTFQMTMIY